MDIFLTFGPFVPFLLLFVVMILGAIWLIIILVKAIIKELKK